MFLNLYFIATSAILLQAGYGSAVAIKRTVDCDPISMYSVDYFTERKTYEPPASTCLFYTAWLSKVAQRFEGDGTGVTTIWNIWPCNLYNGDTEDESNPLRCFFERANNGDVADRTTYFEHMSEAMAISCDIFAMVMTNYTDDIPQDGIWGRVEEPALHRTGNPGGQVDTIIAIDMNGNNVVNVWERPENIELASKNGSSDEGGKLDTSTSSKSHCYTPDQIQEWFGAVPW